MIKYATYNRFAHLFMQFLKNVASTAGSSVSLTLGYKIAARATFEKVLRHNFDLIVSKSQKMQIGLKNNYPRQYSKLNFFVVFCCGQVWAALGIAGHLGLKNLGYELAPTTPAQTMPKMPLPILVPVYYS